MKKQISGKEIRQQFLDFFASKGHTVVRSASLVPAGDHTILFTNAGMVQFKDVFLGTDVRPYTRACDTQKCMRVAGKHNDLDDVGRDDTHHTFFEMLGNWSFGDYYKKEAIAWAWELLTEVWGLDKSKLWTSCFKDEKGEVPADEEAFQIWQEQPGINPDHVLYFGRKENFWEMADTGPCGPCSEIHIDLGEDRCDMKDVPGHVCSVNGDCSRFLELWNLVFIQYNRLDSDTLVPLSKQFVDTGMGFERIVSVLQNVNSNYKTDLFLPMLDRIRELTGTTQEEMMANFTPYRVIADHARAASFLIGDGVVPGNIGRNYICRMIIRRAVRFGQQIGLRDGFMDKIAQIVIEQYGKAFPELERAKDAILQSVRWEESRFNKTLENGMNQLNQIVQEMKSSGKTIVDGQTSFDLYSTHGVPLEITFDVVREFGFDVDREGFIQANQAHRMASGAGKAIGKMGGEGAELFHDHLERLKRENLLSSEGVEFDPYYCGNMNAKVLLLLSESGEPVASLSEGQKGEVITDRTNFYLEMGGQINDTGRIISPDGKFEFIVEGIHRPVSGMILHTGTLKSGEIAQNDTAIVQVDKVRRADIMRNHTATHLLHATLRQVIGNQTRQAGSYVSEERLRFDFHSNRALSPSELDEIEMIVNEKILESIPVCIEIENLDDAMNEGVTAIFDEKYGDTVRVVRILDDDSEEPFSAELCGGTHVSNTSEIGSFIIISEGSVATGIRRIEAVTGHAANSLMRHAVGRMRKISAFLNTNIEGLPAKVEEMQNELHKRLRENQDLRKKVAISKFGKLEEHAQRVGDLNLLSALLQDVEIDVLRTFADQFIQSNKNAVVILGTRKDDQVYFVSAVSEDLIKRGISAGEIVRSVSEIAGGKGGGRPNMAQGGGKLVAKAQEAINSVNHYIETKIKE